MFYQNYLVMRSTADVAGSTLAAVWSQPISGVNTLNTLFAFYDIHGRKREEFMEEKDGQITYL
jgi:hypothetical protein